MSLWAHCKSAASLLVITLNLALGAAPLLIAGLGKLVVPGFRPTADRWMDWIYRAALRVDDWWLSRVIGIEWTHPQLGLDRDRSYVVLSNHVSWSDILLIQSVIVRDGPLLKFLVKRELLALPIVGLICWAYDFPLLWRSSRAGRDDAQRRRADIAAVEEACRIVRESPAAMMNFAEGTRATPEKCAARGNPYEHLLAPRVGGFLALVDGLGDELAGVVDLTLAYPRTISFWAFLAGEISQIDIEARVFERSELPRSREDAAVWLAERWSEKDAWIRALRGSDGASNRGR